jgi:hypothetical protein
MDSGFGRSFFIDCRNLLLSSSTLSSFIEESVLEVLNDGGPLPDAGD